MRAATVLFIACLLAVSAGAQVSTVTGNSRTTDFTFDKLDPGSITILNANFSYLGAFDPPAYAAVPPGTTGTVRVVRLTTDDSLWRGDGASWTRLTVAPGQIEASTTEKPTCAAGIRSQIYIEQGAPGALDKAFVCVHKADNTYAWGEISLTVP